ncbi:MAG: hypothetical protein GDA43_17615 [Hormoscilla sp. SP5CHS1]|nr:hypothetical protein [Hormoscilla sp. SP5CHS1]
MQQPPGAIHSWQEDKQGIFGSGLARGEKTKTIFQVWHLAFVSCQLSVVNARIWNLEAIAISSLTLLYIIWLGLGRNAVILPLLNHRREWRATSADLHHRDENRCGLLGETAQNNTACSHGCTLRYQIPVVPGRTES